MGATTAIVGAFGSLAGGFVSASAARGQGELYQQNAQIENAQYARAAGQEMASAQRGAEEEQRRSRIIQSRALALAAAGGGAADPSVQHIISDLAGQGHYRSQIYGGEARARALRDRGAISLYEGEIGKSDARLKANFDIAGGVMGAGLKVGTSMYEKYSMGGFGKQKAAPILEHSMNKINEDDWPIGGSSKAAKGPATWIKS